METNQCICNVIEGKQEKVAVGSWVDLYISLKDKEYWVEAICEGRASMRIHYCPVCGRKLEDDELETNTEKEIDESDTEILEETMDTLEALKDELKDDSKVEYKTHVMNTETNEIEVKSVSSIDHMYMVLTNTVGQLYQHSYFMKKRGINPIEELEMGKLMDLEPEEVPYDKIELYYSLKYGEEGAKKINPINSSSKGKGQK